METMRQSWTDERLDDFRAETTRRFDALERRMDEGFNETRAEFRSLQRTMNQFGGAMIIGLLGIVATQAGLLATQLF